MITDRLHFLTHGLRGSIHHPCETSRVLIRGAAQLALILILLGITAGVASADATLFAARVGADNPFEPFEGGIEDPKAAPALADLDADGDLDLILGLSTGNFAYYENTGSATVPNFVEQTGSSSPLNGVGNASNSFPALIDLDADGDLDMIAGQSGSGLSYYENTGSATGAGFVLQPGSTSPLGAVNSFLPIGSEPVRPMLGDVDGDGDFDLLVRYSSFHYYFENIGTPTNATFLFQTGTNDPFDGIDLQNVSGGLAMGDLDGDADLDAIFARGFGLSYFENTGDVEAPLFKVADGDANPLEGADFAQRGLPALGDLDGDGDLDLVASVQDQGTLAYFENLQGDLLEQEKKANPLGGIIDGFQVVPELVDLDADGDLDLVSGNSEGTFIYMENTGTNMSPTLAPQTGSANPLDGEDVGINSRVALGDLDGDGDFDLVVGDQMGTFSYFSNTGTATSPIFTQLSGIGNPLDGVDAGSTVTPSMADLDADGDLDLIVAPNFDNSDVGYYENTGNVTSPAFTLRTGAANPLDSATDDGTWGIQRFGDFDGDGDLDLVVDIGTDGYFENTGTSTNPIFSFLPIGQSPLRYITGKAFRRYAGGDLDGDGDIDLLAALWYASELEYFENRGGVMVQRKGTGNPLEGEDIGLVSSPAQADLDADGDLDVLAGKFDGSFSYFLNTGTATSPAFTLQTGATDPMDGESTGGESTPAFADFDHDGDLDLFVGDGSGEILYYQNVGSSTNPIFNFQPFSGVDYIDVGSSASPTMGDLDADGDSDMISGETFGTFAYFENMGPDFAPRIGPANPLDGQDIGNFSKPSLGDFDGDGDLDLTVGDLNGLSHYFENTGSPTDPVFTLLSGMPSPLEIPFAGARSGPSSGDIDGDGDLDLLVGTDDGDFRFYENSIIDPTSQFQGFIAAYNPLRSIDIGSRSAAALSDLDGDGDLDLVSGEEDRHFSFFQNNGSRKHASFLQAANPFGSEVVGSFAKPVIGDLDSDGDDDVISGELNGEFIYYENTGSATSPSFAVVDGLASPLFGAYVGSESAPALGDLDHDGDLDLVSGALDGSIAYFENTGHATSPLFSRISGSGNPFNGEDVGQNSTPALVDTDQDGDLDLVIGERSGTFLFFENTGGATSPMFVRRTGAANPYEGEDVGSFSSPVFADLDGNGKLDLVTGEATGIFETSYVPEPALGLLIGAGLVWLRHLHRRRHAALVSDTALGYGLAMDT